MSALVAYGRTALMEAESWIVYNWLTSECNLSMAEGSKGSDLGLRAQKKILSRMSNKSVAKVFIDDTTARLLDNVYKLAKSYTGNKKEAEKLVKNMIKVVVKIGVLYRNNQFSDDELKQADRFRVRFRAAAMAVISFYEVDFSYDRNYMLQVLAECRASITQLIQNHLSEKSLARVDSVFEFLACAPFLDDIFSKTSKHREIMGRIVTDMNTALDEGGL